MLPTRFTTTSLNPVSRWFDDFRDHFFDDDFTLRKRWMPSVNIVEEPKHFEIDVAAPGMEKNDFKVTVENGMLCIAAEKELTKEETDVNYMLKEFSFNRFERRFNLPEIVNEEDIHAEYKDGILKILLKKLKETPIAVKSVKIE